MIPLVDPDMLTLPARSQRQVFIHPHALVETIRLGDGTSVGPFAVIASGVTVGKGCSIEAHAVIEAGVKLGDRVIVGAGAILVRGTIVEDDAVIGPRAILGPFDRDSKESSLSAVILRQGVEVGPGAIVARGVEIGERSEIDANAVVSQSVPSFSVVSASVHD